MLLTVAICTWNRAGLLERTLEAFQSLKVPAGVQWELLVVNNNCTDNTDQIIDQFQSTLPIRRLFEPQAGHSVARNCAIAAAKGEWILWTDDDVLVDPNWLSAYFEAIRSRPDFSFMGGTIEPWFEKTPPKWLGYHLANLEGAFAIIRRDLQTRPLGNNAENESEPIFGANMVFKTQLLKENLFNPNLGLVGNNPMRGDETELISRLTSSGHRGLWVGNATVKHFIPNARMTTSYLWGFFKGLGQAQTRLSQPEKVSTLFGRPRWALKAFTTSWLASSALLPVKNSLWLHHFKRAARCAGIIQESLNQKVLSN
jgi:glycosyltransferase involved in cell wall biosynthesis